VEVDKMKSKLLWPIFWALIGVFVVAVSVMAIPPVRELIEGFLFMVIAGAVFIVLSAVLLWLTVREKVRGRLRAFLLLTGASALGIPVSVLLHNAVYGLFIYWFGADFWKGGDEPFFFIMGVIVCPLGFLVGVVCSIIMAVRKRAQTGVT
jgi:hypothetical protein